MAMPISVNLAEQLCAEGARLMVVFEQIGLRPLFGHEWTALLAWAQGLRALAADADPYTDSLTRQHERLQLNSMIQKGSERFSQHDLATKKHALAEMCAFAESIALRAKAVEYENAQYRAQHEQAAVGEGLPHFLPLPHEYDVFLSYADGDRDVAAELKEALESEGLRCFVAEKDIRAATVWENEIRAALLGSKRILLLLTPRSVNRSWVLVETGAAWALKKELIPALVQIYPDDLVDPIRKYQARVIETSAQRKNLAKELADTSQGAVRGEGPQKAG